MLNMPKYNVSARSRVFWDLRDDADDDDAEPMKCVECSGNYNRNENN